MKAILNMLKIKKLMVKLLCYGVKNGTLYIGTAILVVQCFFIRQCYIRIHNYKVI